MVSCMNQGKDEFVIKIELEEKMLLKNVIKELREIPRKLNLVKTKKLIPKLLEDTTIKAALNAANIMVTDYLKYNDHGWHHAVIATRNAIKILLVIRDYIKPHIVKYKHGTFDDAMFVTAMGAFLHDIGNMVHRDHHWQTSILIAKPIIWNYINEFYSNESEEKKWKIFAHIANAIFSHDEAVQAFTIEASAVKVGDGCDMAAGRSRRPYSLGKVDIHSVSALSIKDVDIIPGTSEKPLLIKVDMTNPAGIFQVEEVLMGKLNTSLLKDKTTIDVTVRGKQIRLYK